MNWDIVAGNWKQFSGKVKTQWGKLTDSSPTTILTSSPGGATS